jgi:nitroreductase
MNETIRTIKERRSIRSYSDKPIPKKILEELIDCGRLAPSAKNKQPWQFVVITDKNMLKKIASAVVYGSFLRDASACIIILCEDVQFYLEDGCAATENILLAAKSLGIGSCWIAGDKKEYTDKILQLIKAPGGFKLVSIISLGFTNEDIMPKGKKELKEILTWDHF